MILQGNFERCAVKILEKTDCIRNDPAHNERLRDLVKNEVDLLRTFDHVSCSIILVHNCTLFDKSFKLKYMKARYYSHLYTSREVGLQEATMSVWRELVNA